MIQSGIRAGRRPDEGFRRGWHLEFGGLRERIAADADFRDAFRFAEGRTIVALDRLMNLFLLITECLAKIAARAHHRIRQLSLWLGLLYGRAGG
jgi:hypothetical protein